MEKYCINHSEEKAVGICGACGAPTCYRCSMSVDQIVYCSLECFNQLNANSSPQVPRQPTAPAEADASQVNPAFADEYSDVMQSMGGVPSHPAPPVPDLDAPTYLEEESVVLGAPQADESVVLTPPPGDESVVLSASQAEDSTMLGMSPPIPRAFDTSTLVIIPGTRRSVLSSSCFFHPDTSAIVLCADCRNPICSLCARETSAGLTCSPSCGPADPAGAYLRRTSLLFSVAVAAGIFVFVAGGFYLVRETRSKLASGAVLAQAGADAAAAAERSGPPPPEEIPAPVVPPEEKPEVAPPPAPAPPDPAPLEFKPLTRPAPLRLNPPEPPPVEPVVPEFLPAAPSAVVAPQPPAPAAPVVPAVPRAPAIPVSPAAPVVPAAPSPARPVPAAPVMPAAPVVPAPP